MSSCTFSVFWWEPPWLKWRDQFHAFYLGSHWIKWKDDLASVIGMSENIKEEQTSAIMSDVSCDLRWTHLQPSAQARSHRCSSLLTVGKTRALTVCGWWHLVRENAICIRHNPICLQRIGVCVCSPVCVWVRLCVCVCVCRCSMKTERGESQRDRSALGWHTQTNTLHYRPIYLINWATLSAAKHSATHDCQQPKSSHAHTNRPTQSLQTQSFACWLPVWMTD